MVQEGDQRDVDKYAITPGCPGCRAANMNKPAVNHKEECRKRMTEELVKASDPRIRRETERIIEAAEEEDVRQGQASSSSGLRKGEDTDAGVEEEVEEMESDKELASDDDAMVGNVTEGKTKRKVKGKAKSMGTKQHAERMVAIHRWTVRQRKVMNSMEETVGKKGDVNRVEEEMEAKNLGVLNIIQGTKPQDMVFWDDVSGEMLDTDLVITARAEEMAEFKKHGVYRVVKISECLRATGKGPIWGAMD